MICVLIWRLWMWKIGKHCHLIVRLEMTWLRKPKRTKGCKANYYYYFDSTAQHGFWSSAADHSRLFYLWWFGSNFSFLVSLNHYHFVCPSVLCPSLVLNPVGFQSVNFLTSSIFSILLRCPHHFISGFI